MTFEPIQTYVFFDCETTGLNAARITEISLAAVHRAELIKFAKTVTTTLSSSNEEDSLDTLVPRVVNKLTLAVNPMKPVSLFIEELTGLSNYNLEHQSKFRDGAGPLMQQFLYSLAPPVCLVAHNGDRFDFPVLNKELKLAGIKLKSNLLCCDSLKFLRTHFKKKDDIRANQIDSIAGCNGDDKIKVDGITSLPRDDDAYSLSSLNTPSKNQNSSPFLDTPTKTPLVGDSGTSNAPHDANVNDDDNDGIFDDSFDEDCLDSHVLLAAIDGTPIKSSGDAPIKENCGANGVSDMKENLPGKLVESQKFFTPKKSLPDSDIEDSPQVFSTPPTSPPKKEIVSDNTTALQGQLPANKAIKSLPFNDPHESEKKIVNKKQPTSFSLPVLYKHLFGREPRVSHGAEADTVALLQVVATTGQAFLEWSDNNATCLVDILPKS
eukprot:TRINITY_DN15973_c0_g1_i6.p1 TRINITY_DN15973_c0_g1~~TRINITY_DN15973_c0_g1_i6.p1  ORF type:complete len:436 (-),score=89.43 TRINITY_DN15973_c0_g1_i6:732-2039(-)